MDQPIKVIFVRDTVEEKDVALQGGTFAIYDRQPHLSDDCERTFHLSTTVETDKFANMAGCRQTPITGKLVRSEFICSREQLNHFLIDNFSSLYFN